MDAHVMDDLAALIEAERRKPLSKARVASGLEGHQRSVTAREAAENLLVKALRALRDDDAERAERFIDRAVGLPHDDHEDVQPGVYAAHMMLFDDLTDALEADDPEWLEHALSILPECPPLAQTELLESLAVILHDDELIDYELTHEERRQIAKALRARPEITVSMDAPAPEDPAGYVRAVLDAVRRYGWR